MDDSWGPRVYRMPTAAYLTHEQLKSRKQIAELAPARFLPRLLLTSSATSVPPLLTLREPAHQRDHQRQRAYAKHDTSAHVAGPLPPDSGTGAKGQARCRRRQRHDPPV